MKTTQYFRYTRERPERVIIQDNWILRAIKNLLKEEVQSDGRIRRSIRIPEWGIVLCAFFFLKTVRLFITSFLTADLRNRKNAYQIF